MAVGGLPRVEDVARPHVEAVVVAAQADGRPQHAAPLDLGLPEDPEGGLVEGIVANRLETLACHGAVQADIAHRVVPGLAADGVLDVPSEEARHPPVRHAPTGRHAAVRLLDLVAVDRVLEEVGEVREEIEPVAEHEAGHPRRRAARGPLRVGGKAVAVGLAPVRVVDVSESSDEPLVDRPLRHLVGRVPVGPVAHAREREAVPRVAEAVAQDAVDLPQVVGHLPRAVVLHQFEPGQQVSAAHLR
jgi:hypothetical protein